MQQGQVKILLCQQGMLGYIVRSVSSASQTTQWLKCLVPSGTPGLPVPCRTPVPPVLCGTPSPPSPMWDTWSPRKHLATRRLCQPMCHIVMKQVLIKGVWTTTLEDRCTH